MPGFIVVQNLLKEVQVPQNGTLSRTIHRDDNVNIEVLAFAGGQQLSQHTASVPAIIEILQGDARITLDTEEREFSTGSWAYMEANLPHAVYARTDVIMLLTMLTGAQPAKIASVTLSSAFYSEAQQPAGCWSPEKLREAD